MRSKRLIALLFAACLALSGCSISGEIENQAYALVLGIDGSVDGQLTLTARVPQIGKGGGDSQSEDGSGQSAYLVFSAAGDGYAQALEALQWITPRELNLSHIGMLVVSEDLARDERFGELVEAIAGTPHLYTTARMVVCAGRAEDFVRAQETIIGTRLSAEINAIMDHYVQHGYIPNSSFAEVAFATNSIYSDPSAAWGYLDSANAEVEASLLINAGDRPSEGDSAESPVRQRIAGAALFRNGRLALRLDLKQTQLLNLVRGDIASLPVECDGATHELTPDNAAMRAVALDGGDARLILDVRLSTVEYLSSDDLGRVELQLERELEALITACQRAGVEPFGFAEAAAGHFGTVGDWLAFDWRGYFSSAAPDVRVSVRSTGSR